MICDAFSEKNIKSSGATIKFLYDKIKFGSNLHNSKKTTIKITNNAFFLFRYPCVGSSLKSGAHAVSSAQCEFLEYGGHSSHVMNVRWSVGD